MLPDETRIISSSLKLSAELVQRFFVSAIFLRINEKQLIILSNSDQNQIISFCQDASRILREKLTFIALKPRDFELNSADKKGLTAIFSKMPAGRSENINSEKFLVEFDTSPLEKKDKIRLYQKLYGYSSNAPAKINNQKLAARKKSRSKSGIRTGNKITSAGKYEYPGMLEQLGARKIGKSALIVDSMHIGSIELFFASLNVPIIKTRVLLE